MAIYKTITTSPATTTLITKGGTVSGRINKILITNTHSSATQSTRIDLYDGTNTFILYNNIDIPPKTSLALTDNISFDSSEFNLRLTTTGSSTCDIIIK